MIRLAKLLRRARLEEEGSALALALVFLFLFSIWIAVVLAFVDTGLRASQAIESERSVLYALDGAVEAAINHIEGEGECPDDVPEINGIAPAIVCTGTLGNGNGGASGDNTPEFAILTLSTHANEHGIEQTSNVTTTVKGNVWSNSNVRIAQNATFMLTEGSIHAITTCGPGEIDPECTFETVPQADPRIANSAGWAKDAPTVPPFRLAPGCGGTVVEFEPGYYDDAAALTALMSGGGCPTNIFWFKPGDYYFDFRHGPSREWLIDKRISDETVIAVAGAASTSMPNIRTKLPGERCKEDPAAADGVQFIFGHESRLRVEAGEIELCAKPLGDKQQIAIYGLPEGDTPPDPAEDVTTTPSDADATPLFLNEGNALTINAVGDCDVTTCASATLVRNTAPSASITLSGFGVAPGTVVPFGSVITSATLRVAHKEEGSERLRIRATITQPRGPTGEFPCCSGPEASRIPLSSTYTVREIDVSSLFTTFTGATVAFEAELTSGPSGGTGTAWLDGIEFVLTYAPPSFRAQAGCLVAQPYPSGPACALIRTDGNHSRFVVQGTVYAPLAPIDINLPNQSEQLFRRGLVSRVLRLGVPASAAQTGPTISLPDLGGGAGEGPILIIASHEGREIRALVRFPSSGPVIDRWSVVR